MAKIKKTKGVVKKRKVGTNLRDSVKERRPKKSEVSFVVPKAEDAAAAREEDGATFWSAKEGRNVVLVLPPTQKSGLKLPWLTVAAHYVGGADVMKILGIDRPEDLQMAYGCNQVLNDRPCLWCDKQAELRKSKSKRDQKLARALWANKSFYVNLVDLSDPKKARIGRIPKIVKDTLRDGIEDGQIFCDPTNLRKIVIRRKGTGMSTKYQCAILPDSVGKIKQSWVDSMQDLATVIPPIADEDDFEEACDLLFESAAGAEEADVGLDSDFGDDDVAF